MKKILLNIICCLAGLLSAKAQTLYGTTVNGGSYGVGTINKLMATTNDFSLVYSPKGIEGRNPTYSSLVQASDGKLYGVTEQGGTNNVGTIFSYDPVSATYTTLKNFDTTGGAYPNGTMIQASDGKLYGMTGGGGGGYGVIFSFDPFTHAYAKLRDFEPNTGSRPRGDLLQATNGKLYGVTSQGGTNHNNQGVVFSFDPQTSIYTIVKSFDGVRGAYPSGTLIQLPNGKLYGMTYNKTFDLGHPGDGLIYSLDPVTSAYTVLLDFDTTPGKTPVGGLIQANNGKLYGMTYALTSKSGLPDQGIIFSFDPVSSVFTVVQQNIGNPNSGLVEASDEKLYGMSYRTSLSTGPPPSDGKIFSFDPSTSVFASLHDFTNVDGSHPLGVLMQANDGKLYGMTHEGGSTYQIDGDNFGAGVIFSMNPSSQVYTKLKDFGANETGSHIQGDMVLANNGKFYGMTSSGGAHGAGVIFSYDTTSSTYLKLKDFGGTDGTYPYGSLLQASDGKLYGMTSGGGVSDSGVIFSYDPIASMYKVLKNFSGADGASPRGSLVEVNGIFYGMTTEGGTENTGVIFSFNPVNSTYKKLKDLTFITGNRPAGSLLAANDGKLYGLTSGGGSNNTGAGTLFSISPTNSSFFVLHNFHYDNANGANPGGTLIQASNGKLYGTTSNGGSNLNVHGVIFSFDLLDPVFTKVAEFSNVNTGFTPTGTIIQASDGKIYGNTMEGGTYNAGTIYSIDPATNLLSKLKDFDGPNGARPSAGFVEVPECTTNTAYYADADGDGYGDPYKWKIATSKPTGYVSNNKDCDDKNKAVHPVTYYRDADGDSFGDANVSITICGQAVPAGYTKNKSDDDDHHKLEYKISNYPNPFKESSVIKYALPFDSKVSVTVYDLSGKPVATLVNENKKAGFYFVNFKGDSYSQGMLYYKITADSKDQHFEQTNKMVLLK